MGEEAAAAARRIVEEVLAQHDAPAEDASDAGRAPGTEPPPVFSQEPAGGRATESAGGASPEPAGASGSARPESPAGRHEVVSEAERIARRIVDEVLAEEAEVTVRGVPRDGLPVEAERTAKIEMDPGAGATTQRVPGGSGAAASAESPGVPGAAASKEPPAGSSGPRSAATPGPGATPEPEPDPDQDSAEDVVRRIVADVQAEGQPAGGAPEGVGLPVGMTEQSGDPAAVAEDEGTTRVVPGIGEKREAPSESTSGPLALAEDGAPAAGRPLVGWAPPPETEPAEVPLTEDPPPRTLRWLVASLLGAVALAVLFPLAVAALRALVSLG